MSKDEVSRRFAVGALGIGAAAAATSMARTLAGASAADATSAVDAVENEPSAEAVVDPALAQARTLVEPLTEGSSLRGWRVERVLAVQNGAASLVMSDASGQRFQLDVCARDPSAAHVGPGRTELFEIFLANSGDGTVATFEQHGLAAMALADVVRSNEHRVELGRFLTLAERLNQGFARVHV